MCLYKKNNTHHFNQLFHTHNDITILLNVGILILFIEINIIVNN